MQLKRNAAADLVAAFLCSFALSSWAQTPSAPNDAGAPGTTVDRVVLPNVAIGIVKGYTWATPHFLLMDGAPLRLVEYSGGALEGLASGDGRLISGNPPPPARPGVFLGYGNPFGERGFVFDGAFQNGLPSGKGGYLDRMTNLKLQGVYAGSFKLDGPGVISIGELPLVFATFARGELDDGPYRRLLYTPGGSGPTHEYVGRLVNGFAEGTWRRLDWSEQVAGTIYSSKDGTLHVTRAGDPPVTCVPLLTDLLPAPKLSHATNTTDALQARTDPTVTPRHMRCEEPVGAKGKVVYEVISTEGGSTVRPISCSNERGSGGSLTYADNKLVCRFPSHRHGAPTDPFTQMWRDLKKMF